MLSRKRSMILSQSASCLGYSNSAVTLPACLAASSASTVVARSPAEHLHIVFSAGEMVSHARNMSFGRRSAHRGSPETGGDFL